MSDSVNKPIVPYSQRARKVLQYGQRGNHQDQIVRGGLEVFGVLWADEVIAACKNAGLDHKPIHRFTEHLEGYRRQDPIQHTGSLRVARAIRSELESDGTATPARSTTPAKVTPVQADKTDRKDSAPAPTAADGKTASTAIRPAQATQNKQVHLDEDMSSGEAALRLLDADVTAGAV